MGRARDQAAEGADASRSTPGVTWVQPFAVHRARVLALGRRTRQVIGFAALTGLLTGLGVAGFEEVTRTQVFDRVAALPTWAVIAMPAVGLLLSAALLRWVAGGVGPSTADEYIRNFHDPSRRLDLRPVPGRLAASAATLGFGGAMGYEGPSIYLGAAVGSFLQRRFARFFSREESKVLLVAGAAAGVAAIFKAPVTGLVFALEVPYQDDLARRMILPAGIASATAYVTFVSFMGTAPLFSVAGSPPFDLRDLGGAALLGVLSGVGARAWVRALLWAKHLGVNMDPFVRALAGGVVLLALGALSWWLLGEPLTVGAGYDTLSWSVDAQRAIGLVIALLLLRALATIATVAAGGVGGLFIPLVVEGALLGRVVGGLVDTPAGATNSFFPLVGVAAFLGAGYRVPLAGVVFAAEATGRPGFIVPGMVAAMVAQLFMGSTSASTYQQPGRRGHLETRLDLPIAAALRTDVATVPPEATLQEFFEHHLLGNRERSVPVVDGNRFLGLMGLDQLQDLPHEVWETELVGGHLTGDVEALGPGATLNDAIALLSERDVDVVAVVDDEQFVGVVTMAEIVKLEEILDRTGGG
ncbi:MAG: chloride channel protein [Acidimicrobiales bacterium]